VLKKNLISQLFQWGVAFAIAIVITNSIVFVYNRPSGWIDRNKGATQSIWDPNTIVIMGTEGRGVHHVDKKGYLNANLPLEEGYCLVVGASYTQGKEVSSGERYTDLLNAMLCKSDDKIAVYNVSQDGYFLPDIINGFYAITQEFPDAGSLVIETRSTDYAPLEIITATNQRGYDSMQNGENIYNLLSYKKIMMMRVKEFFPIITSLKSQIDIVRLNSKQIVETETGVERNLDEYRTAIDLALSLVRSEYDGKLIILFHPTLSIEENGDLSIISSDTDSIFEDLCRKNDIDFINTTNAFFNEYKRSYVVPYGFFNTTMGNGHLNVAGHQIIADELYKALKGGDAE